MAVGHRFVELLVPVLSHQRLGTKPQYLPIFASAIPLLQAAPLLLLWSLCLFVRVPRRARRT